jgi:hypothetical protein
MIHVDDTIVCCNVDNAFDRLEKKLQKKFEITIKEDADAYLGIHLEELPDKSIRMTQPKLLQSLFNEFPPRNNNRNKSSVPVKPFFLKQNTTSRSISTKRHLHLLGNVNVFN